MTTPQTTTTAWLRGLTAAILLSIATVPNFAQDVKSVEKSAKVIPSSLAVTSVPAGIASWKQVGETGAWKETIAGTAMDGLIYTVENSGALYVTDPATGSWKQIGGAEFHGTRHMFAVSPDLYTIESSGSLYRVSASNGTWERIGRAGTWKATIAGTMLDGMLYTVESNGALYLTNLATGTWKQIGTSEFHDTLHMFAVGSDLYTIESSGNLYRVNPARGSWNQVGAAGAWKGTIAGAMLDETIYTVDSSGALYATDPTTGTWDKIDGIHQMDTRFLVATAGRLLTIARDGSLYAIETK